MSAEFVVPAPAASNPGEASWSELIDVREILRTLNRYKWGIMSITLVVVLLVALILYAMTPVYRATATLMIEFQPIKPMQQLEEVYDPGYGTDEYLGTQYHVLKSRELARRVIERLDLLKYPEFAQPEQDRPAGQALDWRKWLPFLPKRAAPATEKPDEQRRVEQAIDTFSQMLTVDFVFGSYLVKVNFESQDPKLAALAANTLVDVFLESNLEARLSTTRKASSWLTDRLKVIREDLGRAEQALQAFRERENLVNVGGSRGLAEVELADNALRLREARRKKAELASTYWKVQQAGNNPAQLEQASALLDKLPVQHARNVRLEAKQAIDALSSRYGPKHPKLIAARATYETANAAYEQELRKAALGIKAEYEIAQETERQLGQFEAGARDQILSLDRKEYELSSLERDVQTNRELYNLFMTRFKETDTASGFETLNARIVDPAVVPDRPYKPRKARALVLAMIGGLFLGLLAALVRHLLSDTIASSQELEQLTGLPILGVLPELPNLKPGKTAVVLEQPKSSYSEGMRSIRTGLVLSDLDQKKKRLIITSSAPQEGKTTAALNLAIVLGQMERVLLIDADLRRPAVSKQIGLSSGKAGLIELLSDLAKPENCIYRYEQGNIDVMPVGKLPPNPGEILASQRFRKLIEVLSARYDRIVFDSAPCQAVSDTLLLAQNADAVIFLIKSEKTTKGLVKHSIRQLRHARAPLIGAVVNAVDMERHARYYDSYYYAYRYYE